MKYIVACKEVTKLVSGTAGKTSVVMAGVHGNEPCGIEAFKSLLPTLKIDAGTVYFVIGNPNAIAKNIRFTEFNLNRAFKSANMLTVEERNSYEYQRAQFLKRYLDKAGALLDIHSSFTTESTPFAICEDNGRKIASRLPVGLVVSGFDQLHPGGTDGYMNASGKIGICIECGHHDDPKAVEVAEEAILSFLSSRRHIVHAELDLQFHQRHLMFENLYRSTGKLEVAKNWGDFEKVPHGSIICVDAGNEVRAEKDCIIVFARNCDKAGQEAFCLGKDITKLGPYGDWPKDGH